jgi:hypothetical protein
LSLTGKNLKIRILNATDHDIAIQVDHVKYCMILNQRISEFLSQLEEKIRNRQGSVRVDIARMVAIVSAVILISPISSEAS